MYKGLTAEQVKEKKEQGLVNVTENTLTRSYEDIIRGNLLTYFNIVNAVLFLFVLITGHIQNGTFFITVLFNSAIGIYQEIRAKKLLDQLKIMVAAKVPVCRDGIWEEIPTEEIVQDDLIRIESGIQIPADGVLLNGYLEVDESMLTGESEHVSHREGEEISAGTICTSGSAEVQVLRVGKDSASAHIMAEAGKYKKAKSELNESLTRLLHIISIAIIPTGIILFATQYFEIGLTWQDADLKTVAAVVDLSCTDLADALKNYRQTAKEEARLEAEQFAKAFQEEEAAREAAIAAQEAALAEKKRLEEEERLKREAEIAEVERKAALEAERREADLKAGLDSIQDFTAATVASDINKEHYMKIVLPDDDDPDFGGMVFH